MTSEDNNISWIHCGYDEKYSELLVRIIALVICLILQFKSEGEGGLPEFLDRLPSDQVVWGAFKVTLVIILCFNFRRLLELITVVMLFL